MTSQERKWIDAKLANYPKDITPEQRAALVKKFRAIWPFSGGPSLSEETMRAVVS